MFGCANRAPTGLFTIEWLEDGSIGIQATNGRYVTARMNGSLYAVSESLGDRERFVMTIINRPLLVLRCDFGFVGFRTPSNPRYECNKAYYDVIYVEQSNTAAYYLKGSSTATYDVLCITDRCFRYVSPWPCPVSERLAKRLSKKSASF